MGPKASRVENAVPWRGDCIKRIFPWFSRRSLHDGDGDSFHSLCETLRLQSCCSSSFCSSTYHSFASSSDARDGCEMAAAVLLSEARGSVTMMTSTYNTLAKRLESSPEDIDLKVACAEALVSVMRIGSHGNAPTCHFKNGPRLRPTLVSGDTPENRALWSRLAPKAQALLAEVEAKLGRDAFQKRSELFALSLECVMYAAAANGIVASVVSGKAVTFLSMLSALERCHPAFDSGIWRVFQGGFLLAAPWPAYDARKARRVLDAAAAEFPASRRNNFFAGIGRFITEDFKGARESMENALRQPSPSSIEEDVRDFIGAEAARVLEILAEKGF